MEECLPSIPKDLGSHSQHKINNEMHICLAVPHGQPSLADSYYLSHMGRLACVLGSCACARSLLTSTGCPSSATENNGKGTAKCR